MSLFLQRIIRRGNALHQYLLRLHLKGLLSVRSSDHGSADDHRSSHIHLAKLLEIGELLPVYHLQRLKEGSVVDHQKPEIFGIPVAANPSSHRNLRTQVLFTAAVKLPDVCQIHAVISFSIHFP